VSIRSWFRKQSKEHDAEELERREEMGHETAEEQQYTAGDIAGIGTDERAARLAGEASIKDVERLGDF
jgi:hypothetical protein